jgi:hypothetical protein
MISSGIPTVAYRGGWTPVNVFILLLAGIVPVQCQQAVEVWAVSGGVRVNPITGLLFEARPDIHKDYPSNDPRRGNSVWNPETRTVSLRAARNEFVAFQVIVETTSNLTNADVHFAALKGPSGASIDRLNIALFKEWYVNVRNATTGYEKTSLGPGWYPDALMPERRVDLFTGLPFSIPDVYNNIPGQKNQGVWVDVFVPYDRKAAPPGRYSGNVVVSWKGRSDVIKIALDVWVLRCRRKAICPAISGMARCAICRRPRSLLTISWRGSTVSLC